MRTALLYIRQSRHRDYKRTVSPQVQEEGCRGLPAVRRCDRVEVFVDLDKSGKTTAGRKEFRAFLNRLLEPPPDVVAVYDQSRTFRNASEALQFRALMIERLPQVAVAMVHGSFERSAVGKFSYTTLAAAHEMERDMVAEKMRDTYRFKAGRGEMVGQVPAGYVRDPETGEVTIDGEVADVIRSIFEEYATGRYGVRGLAHRLNSRGIRVPSMRGEWKGDTVAQLLGNVAYIGKTHTERRRNHQGDLIEARWPALIDQDVWDAVQRQKGLRDRSGGRSHAGGARHYVFGKLLRCSCSRKLHANTIKESIYYRCAGVDATHPCRSLVREALLLPWAQALFEALDELQPIEFADEVHRQSESESAVRSPGALVQLDATLERLGRRFEWGHIDEAAYQAEWKRLQALKSEMAAAEAVVQPSIVLDGILAAWNGSDAQGRRELLGTLFDELDVEDGRIIGYKPRHDHEVEVTALMERVFERRTDARGCATVGREGVEPPQLSRRFYRSRLMNGVTAV
jgi:DNA invertase Pin-like site-specific DNA recombinase